MGSFGALGAKAASATAAVGGIAAAFLSAKAAVSLFDKTIGAAANYEMREVTVKAMFSDEYSKNAQKYLDFVEERAAVSQFSMDEFLTAGKSFIPTSKDNSQLEKMVNLAERLGAIDPEQGLEGAAYALKEFFSGDAVSLVERFELPRKVMNDIKNLSLDQQLKELDKYLNKIGATNELIEAQSSTAMGEWRKSTAKTAKALREMGTAGLEKITPLLRDFNKWLESADFKRFRDAGVKAFTGLFDGAAKSVRKAANYLDSHFFSNPEFQKIPTIEGKVKFVFDEFNTSLKQWLDSGGSEQIKAAGEAVTNLILNSLETYGPRISDLMATIGKDAIGSFFKGMVESFNLYHADNPLDRQLAKFWDSVYGEGYYASKTGIYYDENGKPQKYVKPPTGTTPGGHNYSGTSGSFGDAKSHSAGLDRVPFNGYAARLHKDEMVLTRGEAQAYRESGGNGGGGRQVVVNLGGVTINNDTDVDAMCAKIAKALAYA